MPEADILVIHQGALGDLVLSLPALHTLKSVLPGCSFEVLGYPGTLQLIRARRYADTVRCVDWAPLSTLYGDPGDVKEDAAAYLARFKRIFVFSARPGSIFINNVKRCNPAGAVHIRTFPDTLRHVIDFQLDQLAGMGLAPADPIPRLDLSDEAVTRAGHYLAQHAFDKLQGPLIALHPGSGGAHKIWPLDHFLSVMRRLHEERRAAFLVVSGPAEEYATSKIRAGLHDFRHLLLRNLDLPLLAALVSRSALFIGSDSGITHMAAALGTPSIAVFGPTDPLIWGPRGRVVSILQDHTRGGHWRWPEADAVVRSARGLLAG